MAKSAEDDLIGLAAATANRLRLLQVDFADQPDAERLRFLSEEVHRVVGSMAADRRREFLEELSRRFPTWDGDGSAAPAPAAAVGRSEMDQRESEQPGWLVDKLCKLASTLTPEMRAGIAERLAEFGIDRPASAGAWSESSAAAVRAKLQVPRQQPLDATRMVELLDQLLDLALSIEQVAWPMWRRLAPNSHVRRPQQQLRDVVRAFLAGDPNVPRPRLVTDVQAVRKIVAAILTTIEEVPTRFASEHAERISPGQIEGAVKAEGKLVMIPGRLETTCWRRFVDMSQQVEAAGIQRELTQVIVEWVERLHK